MSFETTALPSELLVSPQPLVGVCGLDVSKNAVHKTIWDTFSNNRKAERPSVQFKLLPDNYDFPVGKQQKSYEWYHPTGILKRNWMLKHLHVLPSVVVLFQDLEWNDLQWTEKQLQCVNSLQSLKNALRERDTRICLVLIQQTPLPPGEDLVASERAASLIAATGINSKMLFILPQSEHLMGYVLRLESAFLDMAQSYYALMTKRIRTHSDQLTTAHTLLKIRHQFKLGFIAEIRQDLNTSLKHYTQSYTTLDEIRITEANCLEIKTVAGFLNYKICRLMFKLKVPRDSINHFISHIDKYRNKTGSKDLLFEHYAWLSTQHKVFAELFAEAIKNGLPALQTQHPGIYFHKSAEYLQKRREAFKLVNANSSSPKDVENICNIQTTSLHSDYFGVRQVVSSEPLTERQIFFIVLENEKHYNHSMSIINMLSLAMAQFKIYKCLRFRKKLAIEMADEYFNSGDHGKALTLYSLMLTDFRSDNWHLLFSDVLFKTLKCALQTASIETYLSCNLEALSLKIKYTTSQRVVALENMWKVLQGEPPIPRTVTTSNVFSYWEDALANIKSPIKIDLDKLIDFIDIVPSFEKYEINNDDLMRFSVIIRLQTDVPIKIRNLHITITDGCKNYKIPPCQYTQYKDIHNLKELRSTTSFNSPLCTNEQHLLLEPIYYYRFLFVTEAQQFMENIQLRVARLEAQIGTDKLSMSIYKSIPHVNNILRNHNELSGLGDQFKITPICYIKPTFHLIVNCNTNKNTMLVNEYYPVTLTISNPCDVFMTGIGIHIDVPSSLKYKVFLAYDVAPNKQKLHSSIQIDVGDLAMNTFNTVHFFIFSLVEATIDLQQKIFYVTDVLKPKISTAIVISNVPLPNSTDASPECLSSSEKVLTSFSNVPEALSHPPIKLEFLNQNTIRKMQETPFSVKCESEFKLKGRFYTLNRKPLTKIFFGETFLFRAGLEANKDAQLEILETYFLCDQNLIQTCYSLKRNLGGNSCNFEDILFLRAVGRPGETVLDNKRNVTDGVGQLQIFKYLKHYRKHLCHLSDKKSTKDKFCDSYTTQSKVSMIDGMQCFDKNSSSFLEENKIENFTDNSRRDEQAQLQASKQSQSNRFVYNKALDAIHANGHSKGFIRESVLTSDLAKQNTKYLFGLYCVKWRRNENKEENESKFVIQGIPLLEPPLNIFCNIEEKMFVKIPLNFKVTLKNKTAKTMHLTAVLNISLSDNFICSGHKQIDVSIFSFCEKELVYNLYPLQVGWQSLPELTLVYNVQDRTKDEQQDTLLSELVRRSIPKKVFVLPPSKQYLR